MNQPSPLRWHKTMPLIKGLFTWILLPYFLWHITGCLDTSLDLQKLNNLQDFSDGFRAHLGAHQNLNVVHLEVEPASDIPHQFPNVQLSDLKKNGLRLHPKIFIKGKIWGADELLIPEPKKIRALAESSGSFADIIAVPRNISFESSLPKPLVASTKADRAGEFQLGIFADQSYYLVQNANGTQKKPPLILPIGPTNNRSGALFEIKPARTIVRGRIHYPALSRLINPDELSLQIKVTQGSRLVSSVGSPNKHGEFEVELSWPFFSGSNEVPLFLLIEPISKLSPLPRIQKKLSIGAQTRTAELGEISLGELGSAFPVSITILGFDDTPIENAVIYLRAPIGQGKTHIERTVNRSGQMVFENLFQGLYDIAVIPPPNSPFAMRVLTEVPIEPNKSIISIDLHKRKPLYGKITDRHDKAIEGTRLELTRIGKIGASTTEDIFDQTLIMVQASTDGQGNLCGRHYGIQTAAVDQCSPLYLDEGRYRARIIPPPGSHLGQSWTTIDFPENQHLDVKLLPPLTINGHIFDSDGKKPVRKAFVTIYAHKQSGLDQPEIIGSAITNENGEFNAYVSAP